MKDVHAGYTPAELCELHGKSYTGFVSKKADVLRRACRDAGVAVAGDAAGMWRQWYELVLQEPIPPEILAKTGRQAKDPPSHPDALKLARTLGIDLSSVPGSGTGGVIAYGDVVEFAKRQAAVVADLVAEEKPNLRKFEEDQKVNARALAERQQEVLAENDSLKAEIERLRAEKEKLSADVDELLTEKVEPTPEPTPEPKKAPKAKGKSPEQVDIHFD